MEGTTIVISPLLALQFDMCEDLNRRGIKAAAINSTTGKKELAKIKASLEDKSLKLLYMAPETLLKLNEHEEYVWLNYFSESCTINHIAIDEAHSILEASQDFRPKYKKLKIVIDHFLEHNIPVTALTATCSPSGIQEVMQSLDVKEYQIYSHHLHRENLHFKSVLKVDEKIQLLQILKKYKNSKGLIYCNTRNKCEIVSEYLNTLGKKTAYFHSTIKKSDKLKILNDILNGQIDCVICTSSFGTGVNIPDIRYVINLDIPDSFNTLLQQWGRAGRDGNSSDCYVLYSREDVGILKFIFKKSIKSPVRLSKAYKELDEVYKFCLSTYSCRSEQLLNYYGQNLNNNLCNCDYCT